MRAALLSLFLLAPTIALAEGACPPGQYPVGGQGVVGCAPIPQGGTGGSVGAPRPTGKWETRWGAVVEDNTSSNLATGTAVSRKSKREAIAAATLVCEEMGGKKMQATDYVLQPVRRPCGSNRGIAARRCYTDDRVCRKDD